VDVLKNKHFIASGRIQTTILWISYPQSSAERESDERFCVRVCSDYCHSE